MDLRRIAVRTPGFVGACAAGGEGPFWSPAPAQIEVLERELSAYLRQQGHAKEADGLARSCGNMWGLSAPTGN